MKIIQKTLYISTPYLSLSLENENIVIKDIAKFPLKNFDRIIVIECANATIPLLSYCSEHHIDVVFLNSKGEFKFSINQSVFGSVYVKAAQFEAFKDQNICLEYSRKIVSAKIINQIRLIEASLQNHPYSLNQEFLVLTIEQLTKSLKKIDESKTIDEIRGFEGLAAKYYFSALNELIIKNRDAFCFEARTKRPPKDRTNALLSFCYAMLTNEIGGALEAVGLDPRIGFFHQLKSGRKSLACDLIEELRASFVDRFVLNLINRAQIKPSMFRIKETGEVQIKDSGFKALFTNWEKFRTEEIKHPFLEEKIQRGYLPYVQSLLLAKAVRKELYTYPPYFS